MASPFVPASGPLNTGRPLPRRDSSVPPTAEPGLGRTSDPKHPTAHHPRVCRRPGTGILQSFQVEYHQWWFISAARRAQQNPCGYASSEWRIGQRVARP